MFVTVFRSRLNPDVQDDYGPLAARMSKLAQTMLYSEYKIQVCQVLRASAFLANAISA